MRECVYSVHHILLDQRPRCPVESPGESVQAGRSVSREFFDCVLDFVAGELCFLLGEVKLLDPKSLKI